MITSNSYMPNLKPVVLVVCLRVSVRFLISFVLTVVNMGDESERGNTSSQSCNSLTFFFLSLYFITIILLEIVTVINAPFACFRRSI